MIIKLTTILVFFFSTSLAYSDQSFFIESLKENQLDLKFENFEGGSFESESDVHKKLIQLSFDLMNNMHRENPDRPMTRDAHAKSHGCLMASFDVDNSLLPDIHKIGLFSQNKSYSAWMRFSNNDHLPQRKDNALDLRGVAIKVMGVDGEKILSDNEDAPTQDFLMYGSDIFFIKDNSDYVGFIQGLRDGNAVSVLLREQTTAAFRTFRAQIGMRNYLNPLNPTYFSATPIRLGHPDNPERTTLKYRVKKCTQDKHPAPYKKSEHNYMRLNLKNTLASQEACYNFQVQIQTNNESMPVEDATKKWDQDESPYITVATINIPQQDFDTQERDNYCENLSFTPWHALVEHKPLGRTMRMRRDLYKATSLHRRETNRAKLEEPASFEIE